MKTGMVWAVVLALAGMAWGGMFDEPVSWMGALAAPGDAQPTTVPQNPEATPAREVSPSSQESLREERLWRLLEATERRAAAAEEALRAEEEKGHFDVSSLKAWGSKEDGDVPETEMERLSRLSIRAGAGNHDAVTAEADWIVPLGESPLDFAVGASFMNWHCSYYDYDIKLTTYVGEALVLWRPFRGETFSPYVGLGGRYWATHPRDGYEDEALRVEWRAGVTWKLERFWVNGEYTGGKAKKNLVGTVGYRYNQQMALQAFANRYDMSFDDDYDEVKLSRDGVMVGVGLTWML